ncbi:MAG: hypothetical protein WEB00_09090 [Dehalococcoidia bacterium]
MGGRTATLLVGVAAGAAVLVMAWSLASAFSLTDDAPYWLGSAGIVCAIAATFLILRDLVLWPFKFLGPRLAGLREMLLRWFSSFRSTPAPAPRAKPVVTRPPTRRQH